MSTVNPISHTPPLRTDTARTQDRRPPVEVHIHSEPVDTVDLSEQARLLDSLRARTESSPGQVERIRAEIERGTYLTDEKLDRALDALIDDLLA